MRPRRSSRRRRHAARRRDRWPARSEPRWLVAKRSSLPGVRAALRDRHHPGVVDENVERSVPAVDERGHRGPVCQLKRAHLDGAVASALTGICAAAVSPAAGSRRGEGDRCARMLGRARSLSQCPRSAGDDRAPAGEYHEDFLCGGSSNGVASGAEALVIVCPSSPSVNDTEWLSA